MASHLSAVLDSNDSTVRPSSSGAREFERLRNEQRELRRNARLFDGTNSPQNIATYGFLLGIVGGGGLMFALLSGSTPQFGYFLAALALFHFLEYLATALFNPHKLSLDCKFETCPPHLFLFY